MGVQRAVQQAGITRTPNFVASRCPGAPTPAGSCSCVRARSANIWATPHGYKSRHYRSTIEGAQVHLAAQHRHIHAWQFVAEGVEGGDTSLAQASPCSSKLGCWFFSFSFRKAQVMGCAQSSTAMHLGKLAADGACTARRLVRLCPCWSAHSGTVIHTIHPARPCLCQSSPRTSRCPPVCAILILACPYSLRDSKD